VVHECKETGSFVTWLRSNHHFHLRIGSSDGKPNLTVVVSWAGPTGSDSNNFSLINPEMNPGFLRIPSVTCWFVSSQRSDRAVKFQPSSHQDKSNLQTCRTVVRTSGRQSIDLGLEYGQVAS
jgi:hypothetical protein